jgi:hypothetical protein
MECALALRSVERTVEEVLLPSLDELGDRFGLDSAPWALAARWADGWLRRAQHLAPPPSRPLAILVGDATRNELDPDALAMRAFELFCGRAGARVMALPVGSVAGLGDVVASLSPDAVVIAGRHACDDDVARWAYRVRAATGQLPTAVFRRTQSPAKVRNAAGARVLPDRPFGAQRQLLAIVDHDEIGGEIAPILRAANALPRRGAQA